MSLTERRVSLCRVQIDNRTLTASVAARSVRRAIVAIGDAGPESVAVVLSGRLVGDVIEDAGLAAMPKPAKADKAAAPDGQQTERRSN
jgi:hypothetical protein